MAEPTSLLDMPLPWVKQLLQALGEGEALAMFRCCTLLRNEVLVHRHVTLRLDLPFYPVDVAAAQTSLMRACMHSSGMCLDLQVPYDRRMPQPPQSVCTASARDLLCATMNTLGHALNVVTSVKLPSMEMDGLAPPWLLSACPNMRELTLDFCQLSERSAQDADHSIDLSQIQKLSWFHYFRVGTTVPAWQRQLDTLTGLTSLSTDVYPYFLLGCPALLTRLTELELLNSTVEDDEMEALLRMPQLKHLRCEKFYLRKPFTQRPCSWTHLGVDTIAIVQFDRLPLTGIKLLQVFHFSVQISDDLAACIRVSDAIAQCGGLSWGSKDPAQVGRIEISSLGEADTSCFEALKPILAGLDEAAPITHVKLEGLKLVTVAPSWLLLVCPHMQCLELAYCKLITAGGADQQDIPRCHQIQQLVMNKEPGARVATDSTAWVPWQRQLCALTGLTTLSTYMPPQMLRGCPALLTQLTQLEHRETLIDDEGMEVLLSMPRLKELMISRIQEEHLQLQHSYTQRSCSWTKLVFDPFHIDQIDRLPLDSVKCLQEASGSCLHPRHATWACCVLPSTDVAACARVAAAVVKCGGLTADQLALGNDYLRADKGIVVGPACVLALVPMLAGSNIRHLTLKDIHVTPELLAAMQQLCLVHATWKLHTLSFEQCEWKPLVCPLLLSSLPPVQRMIITKYHEKGGVDEGHIADMCAHATRPMRLLVCSSSDWKTGWQERVHDAMAEAGHQHVTLETDWSGWGFAPAAACVVRKPRSRCTIT